VNFCGASRTGSQGTDGTGGGGGGTGNICSGGGGTRSGFRGGSGIVIFRILSIFTATFSGGVATSVDTTSVPGYKIYTVTSGSGTVTFGYA